MKIKYIADDGTLFDSAVECSNYENSKFKMFDGDLQLTNEFCRAEYFLIDNAWKRDQFIATEYRENGEGDIDFPNDYGIWMYDLYSDKYVTVKDFINKYKAVEETILEAGRYE